MNPDRINALLCAIHSIQGIDGGFSVHEKALAVEQLKNMLAEEEKSGTIKVGGATTLQNDEKKEN